MNMYNIIEKKRDGKELSFEEIQYFIEGYTKGEIEDYQISALLMAIYFQKLNEREILDLTNVMRDSGDIADLSAIPGIKVDKHSSGGVGDKTTLVVAPIAAAAGVTIAKMSGRGLGFTGGTIDKLESIPGFKTSIERDDYIKQLKKIGIAIIGQSAHIAKADKMLYALRDVTATVDSIGLIASSIMSKKLASGSDAIVLDIKCGQGAFMKDIETATELANIMCKIGNTNSKKTVAAITNMNEPLGNNIGNSLEVIEAIETLKGNGPEDFNELCTKLAALMIYVGDIAESYEEAIVIVEKVIKDGTALEKLRKLIYEQGGNPKIIEDYSLFKKPLYSGKIVAKKSGWVTHISADSIGKLSLALGAGREKIQDKIDFSAGVVLKKKVGDEVNEGETLAEIFTDKEELIELAQKNFRNEFVIKNEKVKKEKLVLDMIFKNKEEYFKKL